jgi:hypothetical protein
VAQARAAIREVHVVVLFIVSDVPHIDGRVTDNVNVVCRNYNVTVTSMWLTKGCSLMANPNFWRCGTQLDITPEICLGVPRHFIE